MSDALQLVTDADLRSLASVLRRGELAAPYENEALVARYCPRELAPRVAAAFRQFAVDGFSPAQLARVLDTIVETRVGRPELERLMNLVWTGPEVPGQTHRETASVVRELFASAAASVLVATYVIHHREDIFGPLAERMLAVPSLRVELFVDLNGQTPTEFARRFLEMAWPQGRPLPAVYFDPRSGPVDPQLKASMHAKLVVTDSARVFVTSANFTERPTRRTSRPACGSNRPTSQG
jgi:phosphatidylserine/phosphatidylglycerophosphate/cardiolipin synthase-like enzyme